MPEERVQKNGDAIIAGDFTFELEGNCLRKFLKGIFKKQYQDIACDMMVKHYAFYEELSKVAGVKNRRQQMFSWSLTFTCCLYLLKGGKIKFE